MNELREIERLVAQFHGDILAAWEKEKSKRDNR